MHITLSLYFVSFFLFFLQVEARHEAEKDWADDAPNKNSLAISRERFMDAIFELADHWTSGVSSAEYCSFLRRLLGRITSSHVMHILIWMERYVYTWINR